MLRESKLRPASVAKLVFSSTLMIAGSAFMWGMWTPLPVAVIWLVIVGASLAIDPLGEWRFLTGIAVATVVAGLCWGGNLVATMPNQVVRMLLFEFLPNAPTLIRPVVISLSLWSLLAVVVAGLVPGVALASWRRCVLTVGVFALASTGFIYVMLVQWPDPALGHHSSAPPLGILEMFYSEEPLVDLTEVAEVPPRLPVPPFEVRKGLSYGPHGYRNTLDLYVPQGTQGPLPVVIYIHGGGIMDGGTEAGQDLGLPDVWRDALLSWGLAIANINYRLLLANPGSRHDEVIGPFPAQIQDCLTVVRFLRTKGAGLGLDPDRIGVMGHSFGG